MTELDKIAFYPCCQKDIAGPAAMLSGIADRIVYCDIEPVMRDPRECRPHWPQRSYWCQDAWDAIPQMPRIDVLFYRRDSREGSGFYVFGKFVFPRILARMTAPVSLIITDGANSRGGTIRKMRRRSGLMIDGKHITRSPVQRFEKYGLTEYVVRNLAHDPDADQAADRAAHGFDWSDRGLIQWRPQVEVTPLMPRSPVLEHLAAEGLRRIGSRLSMPDWMTRSENGLFNLMVQEMFERVRSTDDLWHQHAVMRWNDPEKRFAAIDILYRILVRGLLDADEMAVDEALGRIVAEVEEWRPEASDRERWLLDQNQPELDWFVENAHLMRFFSEALQASIHDVLDDAGMAREQRVQWLGEALL